MLHPNHRPSVAHVSFHTRTFWVGALTIMAVAAYAAWSYRVEDSDALLANKLLLHAAIGASLMLAAGVYYRRFPDHQPDQYFYGSTHFWLTFAGILGLMSHELLIPEASLGWNASTSTSPQYYFLHIVSQAVLVPTGGILFLLGQGYFLFRLGMRFASKPEPSRFLPNGEAVA